MDFNTRQIEVVETFETEGRHEEKEEEKRKRKVAMV